MRIFRRYQIEAAHRLTGVPPTHKCSRMHGHNWAITVCITGPVDARTGFVCDFAELDAAMAPVIAATDHQCLNDILDNPTSENFAAWIGAQLAALPGLASVSVAENSDCWVEWARDE